MDKNRTIAEAVAMKDGKIIAVGSDQEIKNHAGAHTQLIDLLGKLVIPGLNDSHIHLSTEASQVYDVSLGDARSIADVVQSIAKRVNETSRGEWVFGKCDWHEGALKEGRLPNRFDLDPVSPDHPVLIRRGGHVATVNSAALERAGITNETPDPLGGVIVKDASGHPIGILFGQPAVQLVAKKIPGKSLVEKAGDLRAIMHKLNQYGITSVTDPRVNDEEIEVYREVWKNEEMTVRATVLRLVEDIEDVKAATSNYSQGEGDDFFTIGGLKYFSDGGIENAYMKDPYEIVPREQEDPEFRGELRVPSGGMKELEDMFTLIAENGWSVGVHAVGDAANEVMVNLYAKVNEKIPIKDLRWVIMHLFLPKDEHLQMMKQIGIMGTIQDQPLLLGHNQRRFHGEKRAHDSIPLRKLVDSGIAFGGGTDAPILPANPFLSLWWMVTRNTLTAGVLGKEHAITREEALYLYTMGSAVTQFKEDKVGSIEPGKLADLAVLSQDYFEVEEDAIKDLKTVLTIVDGKIVYRDPAFQLDPVGLS
ncbi:amidohydrolase [Siminovitchia sediminis]|uniref:Amidohydrolase n=1 Tax=Siminovitchia sediminis TaxID=1274353 RepID=A0ABW4KL13_9BACI